MASKVENRATIVALCAELGVAAPENLEQIDKQVDLEALIADLEKRKAEKAGGTGADGVGAGAVSADGAGGPPPLPTNPGPEAPKKIVATTYEVNLGKSVTTKRGAMGALQPVWPEDFAGGQKDLDFWVSNGAVKKTEHLG
jgi:hypothetical protein